MNYIIKHQKRLAIPSKEQHPSVCSAKPLWPGCLGKCLCTWQNGGTPLPTQLPTLIEQDVL